MTPPLWLARWFGVTPQSRSLRRAQAARQRRATPSKRQLQVEALEDRTVPTISVALTGGTQVAFTGNAAADSLTLTTSGGLLQHNLALGGNLVSSTDMDSTVAGAQTVSVSAITSLTFTDSGTNDTITINSALALAANATVN